MPVKDYNADPDLNTQISGINIAEGCAPSGINNAIRQLMADVKEELEGEEGTVSSLDSTLRAFIAEEVAKCLKTSGGTMTGTILSAIAVALAGNGTPTRINIQSAPSYTDGAYLSLCAEDDPNTPGVAELVARAGSDVSILRVTPSGECSVKGQHLIRSINNLFAGNTGDISIDLGVLSLQGMKGDVTLNDIIVEHLYSSAGGYITLQGGLCIQWGFNSSTTQDVTCSLIAPYKAADYWCGGFICFTAPTSSNYNSFISTRTTTNFVFKTNIAKAASAFWIAIGKA